MKLAVLVVEKVHQIPFEPRKARSREVIDPILRGFVPCFLNHKVHWAKRQTKFITHR
jgi:hypothetical protein